MSTIEFFNKTLADSDKDVFSAISDELQRQKSQIELIASENIVSRAVLEAQGSVLTNKYAEGYPGKRYYGGCAAVDRVEALAIERAKLIFNASFANVQAHSGATANQSVFYAFLKPGDTILGMKLSDGGHLTHGAPKTQSGTWFNSVSYGVKEDSHLIDYDEMDRLADEHKPKLIIAGTSSYPRKIDWKRFREAADRVGAILLVDMAHIAGMVAAGIYESPLLHADVVTSTTHKTLRGPRGGLILTNNEEHSKKINSAVFPGLQGGPLMHVIAAKAVAFGEALKPEYKNYIHQVVQNCQAMSDRLIERGLKITTGGTDCHLAVVDLSGWENMTGRIASDILEEAGLTCNKNGIPFDKQSPFITSGIRIGSSAGTSRGFKAQQFTQVADMIYDVLASHANGDAAACKEVCKQVQRQVSDLCHQFSIYDYM